MAWFFLLIAAVSEILWLVGMKFSDGFTILIPSIFTVFWMIVSFVCLIFAVKVIPVGTAYAIWTGTGAVGIAIISMIFFDEPVEINRLLFIFAIISGVIGLKFFSSDR